MQKSIMWSTLLIFTLPSCAPGELFGPTTTPTAMNTATMAATMTTTITPTKTATPTITPSPTMSLTIGSTLVSPSDGMTMVYVPAGEFLIGSPDGVGRAEEHPQHLMTLETYWIDQTEVTNEMFLAFANDTEYKTYAEQSGNSPVLSAQGWVPVDGADWLHPQGPSPNILGLENTR